ncbi:S24 family peptidase [Acetobacter sp. DsW_063]|uniref:S24 family peptidase n=1 Tax=Acetobacter sp. DsW_063 TaxID=1514894 RepID=UPI000A3B104C|nr:S24 family peptidase [Acetobacter sp. DsW_063]OUJ16507.1 transcriptional regulator [Acetobacter sp. DsW_063]
MTDPSISDRLKELRSRAGYSVREFARLLGYGDRYSSYASYENKYKKPALPLDMAKNMLPLLVDKGEPRITPDDVWSLAGIRAGESALKETIERASRVNAPAPKGSVRIHEYDVSPQAGGGSLIDEVGGNGDVHTAVATWTIPKPFLDSYLPDSSGLAIVRVIGNSMEPDFRAGERVLVDTSHRILSPDGVYVLWNGLGVVLKQLQLVPNTSPPRARIISINQTYPQDEVPLDDITINGRVVGKWLWT